MIFVIFPFLVFVHIFGDLLQILSGFKCEFCFSDFFFTLSSGWCPSPWMVRYIGLSGLAGVADRLSVHICPNNAVITGQSCCMYN